MQRYTCAPMFALTFHSCFMYNPFDFDNVFGFKYIKEKTEKN